MRLVLYISPAMAEQIARDADRRAAVSGLDVRSPVAARSLIGEALAARPVGEALGQIAARLRERGAVPADRVESLASALDELAGRLGGAVEDDHEAALSPASRVALQAGTPVPLPSTVPVYLSPVVYAPDGDTHEGKAS